MLVITRKPSESFDIGDNIRVNILDVNGDKVKIGIDAPKDVKIFRSEVYETIRSNILATTAITPDKLSLLKPKMKKTEEKSPDA